MSSGEPPPRPPNAVQVSAATGLSAVLEKRAATTEGRLWQRCVGLEGQVRSLKFWLLAQGAVAVAAVSVLLALGYRWWAHGG